MPGAGDRARGPRTAALLASLALALAPAPSAHDHAVRIASWGPRPAAGGAERRVHRYIAARFSEAGLDVIVQRFGVPGRGRSRNVIGRLDGPRSCLHVVMAHADSTPDGPGANDNASGLGVLAALAGRLGRSPTRCDIWLVATGAEERVYTAQPTTLERSRSPAGCETARLAGCDGPSRSTRLDATGHSGCVRRAPCRVPPWKAPCWRQPGGRERQSTGYATRAPATPITASSSY
jgi:hypothetical protein